MKTNVRPRNTQEAAQGGPVTMHVALDSDVGDSEELVAIVTRHLPAWLELFASKNGEYQDGVGSAFVLGEKGQFSDMWRKMMKLKRAMWDELDLTTEGVDEILMDLIGHCFLTLEMRARTRDRNGALGTKFREIVLTPEMYPVHFDGVGGLTAETSPALRAILEDKVTAEQTAMFPTSIIFEGQAFTIGDLIWFKQHLGRGKTFRITKIDPTRQDGHCVLTEDLSGQTGAWMHPSWLVPYTGQDDLKIDPTPIAKEPDEDTPAPVFTNEALKTMAKNNEKSN